MAAILPMTAKTSPKTEFHAQLAKWTELIFSLDNEQRGGLQVDRFFTKVSQI